MRIPALLFPVLSAILLAACDKRPEPAPSDSPPSTAASRPSPPSPGGASHPAAPSEVAWDAPARWVAGHPGPMRKATYVVPRAPEDEEGPDMSVSQAGGTVDQNIARWAGQLGKAPGDVKRSTRKVNGLSVTEVEIHGDYTGMRIPGAPATAKRPGYALLGAIVESSPPTFFKLVGPEKSVMAAQPEFEGMVASVRAK